ncbi:hypothetical protein NDU88_005908 [Pleurodeles waltl]|uniref:Uncharacterized protein n=1 Tax=Pleurodeles waltl TaxID=8319 RepID=A0AAV7W948_PLEWA|nr:hypothetical protein NDU88_005908 [Pleurodeles waltl]
MYGGTFAVDRVAACSPYGGCYLLATQHFCHQRGVGRLLPALDTPTRKRIDPAAISVRTGRLLPFFQCGFQTQGPLVSSGSIWGREHLGDHKTSLQASLRQILGAECGRAGSGPVHSFLSSYSEVAAVASQDVVFLSWEKYSISLASLLLRGLICIQRIALPMGEGSPCSIHRLSLHQGRGKSSGFGPR